MFYNKIAVFSLQDTANFPAQRLRCASEMCTLSTEAENRRLYS